MRAKPPPVDWEDVATVVSLTALGSLGGPWGAAAGAGLGAAIVGDKLMIGEKQMGQKYRDVIAEEKKIFDAGATVEDATQLPSVDSIPLDDRKAWVRVPGVICVYIDMKDSTKLAVGSGQENTASAFQLYTGTAVRLLNAFEAPYIDVRGDGAFALFDEGQEYRALAAAVTFKTFAYQVAVPAIEDRCGVKVGSHIGIDQKGVLVRRVGLRRTSDRDDRQNEVWAGKPVNMAAKLASMTEDDEILVSDRFYKRITDDHARLACGCGSSEKTPLWAKEDVPDSGKFDFDTAYRMTTAHWCKGHGKEFMDALLRLSK